MDALGTRVFARDCSPRLYQNIRKDWVIAVEEDASRQILGMVATDSRSTAAPIELLEEVRGEYALTGEILEVITDDSSDFYANTRDKHGESDHAFEQYFVKHGTKHTLCAVGRPNRTQTSSASTRPPSSSDGDSVPWTSSSITTITSDRTRAGDTTRYRRQPSCLSGSCQPSRMRLKGLSLMVVRMQRNNSQTPQSKSMSQPVNIVSSRISSSINRWFLNQRDWL